MHFFNFYFFSKGGVIKKLKVAIFTCEHHSRKYRAKRKLQWEFLQ